MNKKTVVLLMVILGIVVAGGLTLLFSSKKDSSSTPEANTLEAESQQETTAQTAPSKTFITHQDPAGFSFSYPSNLSLKNNESKNTTTYSDIQLSAKGVDGALNLKISDSILKSTDEWAKINKGSSTPKETKLGNLKALEITTDNSVVLGALDQGILFTIEVPNGKSKDFWMSVYNKILTDFSFAQPVQEASTPQAATTTSSSDDVTFEGEEVVE